MKHLQQIIEIFAEAGIVTEGMMSLQSMDEATLTIIRRSNIKVEKYDELAGEFRRTRLPLSVDLMIGLPGLDRRRRSATTCRSASTARCARDANPTLLLAEQPDERARATARSTASSRSPARS